jgi:FMN reductase
MYLVLSCSLNPFSRSRILAKTAADLLGAAGHRTEYLDLHEFPLPICDGDTCYEHPNAKRAAELVRDAEGILLATPVYNYNVNAAAKNFVELTGRAWQDKVVGFLCAAGGKSSYMAVMGLANSLMLDFRCMILPRFVYATGEAFREDDLFAPVVIERLGKLTEDLVRVSTALRTAGH